MRLSPRSSTILFPLLLASALCNAQVITTIAGSGTEAFGGDGGPSTKAWIAQPNGVAVDSAGNIYFADTRNIRVRKVTAAGTISTFAGDGTIKLVLTGASIGDGGPATSAGFSPSPSLFQGIAVDAAGNVYISDGGNRRVRKVDPQGIITTFAGGGTGSGESGQATAAALTLPNGIATDEAGNVYIADSQAGKIRKVTPSGSISTVAGNGSLTSSGDGGPATQAGIGNPLSVTVDKQGNIYFTEQTTFHVRKVDTAGIITTIAGSSIGFDGDGGSATSAKLADLRGLAADNAGNLYISDYGNNRVRKLDASGTITTVAGIGTAGIFLENGDGGLPANSRISPSGLAIDNAGNLLISDYIAARIRKIDFAAVAPGLSISVGALSFASNPNSAPAAQTIKVSSGGPPLAFRVAATSDFEGNPWMTVSTATGSTPQSMTVSVRTLPAGTYNGTITVTPTTPGYQPVTIPVRVTISSPVPAAPAITSVSSGASFEPGVVPNSILTLKGTNLASTTDTWDRFIADGKLPTSLGGVIVTFNGMPAYISYISPTQINLLAPDTGIVSLRIFVNNNGASSPVFSIGAATTGPAFFTWPGSQVVATRQDYSYAVRNGTFASATTIAAKPGDVLILWGTGFGPTTPPVLPGGVTPSDRAYATTTPPTVTVNSVQATVYGAALASGFAGLYQVAIQVPENLPDGDWPIVATIGGVSSPSGVVLAVRRQGALIR